MKPELADRILVWCYSETIAYTRETCDWYAPASFGEMHFEVAHFIQSQLDEFYAEFSEWFNLAEFPDVLEQLKPSEFPVFLKAAGAPDEIDDSSIDNYDCFSGLCAVIRHRLGLRSFEELKLAAELFNWAIDCALFLCDTTGHAIIKLGCVADVAPFVLERILSRLRTDAKHRDPAHQPQPNAFEQRFIPFAELVSMLRETVESTDWMRNQLALEIFFWILSMYKVEVENEGAWHSN
jgi:hypothetical protein